MKFLEITILFISMFNTDMFYTKVRSILTRIPRSCFPLLWKSETKNPLFLENWTSLTAHPSRSTLHIPIEERCNSQCWLPMGGRPIPAVISKRILSISISAASSISSWSSMLSNVSSNISSMIPAWIDNKMPSRSVLHVFPTPLDSTQREL